jgi:hypothetical protein
MRAALAPYFQSIVQALLQAGAYSRPLFSST